MNSLYQVYYGRGIWQVLLLSTHCWLSTLVFPVDTTHRDKPICVSFNRNKPDSGENMCYACCSRERL